MKLGIFIPYYYNSPECEIYFKKLMKTLDKQLTNDTWLYVYEDGQYSRWLEYYNSLGRTCVTSCLNNKGIAYARNKLLEQAKMFDYIMFLDSDDIVDCDFIKLILEACNTGNYDMIISDFMYQGVLMDYPHRCNVAGVCLRTRFIEGLTFDENYNVSEDTLFVNKVYERNPNIFKIDSVYYYNYGVNPNSLMKRFERNELGLRRDSNV